ncbi:aminomethyltransferase, mitochondrial [Anabrus simplex]|uniref:aminomethyltransferase, mitochondrial n=1 Tax=Anabrus simplex TaxID=316456 RepID=UPI0034DD3250
MVRYFNRRLAALLQRLQEAHSETPRSCCAYSTRVVTVYERRGVSGRFTRGLSVASDYQNSDEPRKTSLYNFHVAHAGKMVPFAGFLLPVTYGSEGIATSHLHTRNQCSLFDVSHMMQTEVRGKDGIEYLESICTADLKALPENTATLTVFTDPITGGILDDLIVTKTTLGYLYVVSNASRRSEDQKLMLRAEREFLNQGKKVELRFFSPEERSLLALQGPRAIEALQPLVDVDLAQLYFMGSTLTSVAGIPRCRVTRCGYTGEDGVEISIPAEHATVVAETLLESSVAPIKPAGLGARDTLRLEAGLCLYGHDIDHTTTPVEAGLAWLVGKRRRSTADFPGANVVLQQLRSGVSRRRVGLRSSGGPPARAGARILDQADEQVGHVTSGCPSPSLGCNIAMGYVQSPVAKAGTKVRLEVRGKTVDAEVVKLPFVPSRYYTRGDK